jgi:hypothetical protein
MKLSTLLTRENRGRVASVLGGLILLPFVLSLVGAPFTGEEEMPGVFLEQPDPQYENCVRDAAYMRFQHMDLLKDTREQVIREGVKGGITLAGCGDCHRNREAFCDRCHAAVTLNLDCWGCHYYPETAAERIAARNGR